MHYVVRVQRLPPTEMFRLEVKDEVFADYHTLGYTTESGLRRQFEEIPTPNEPEEILRPTLEAGKGEFRFDPRHWESYLQFREFWFAAVVGDYAEYGGMAPTDEGPRVRARCPRTGHQFLDPTLRDPSFKPLSGLEVRCPHCKASHPLLGPASSR